MIRRTARSADRGIEALLAAGCDSATIAEGFARALALSRTGAVAASRLPSGEKATEVAGSDAPLRVDRLRCRGPRV
jgi:hypothetical protein